MLHCHQKLLSDPQGDFVGDKEQYSCTYQRSTGGLSGGSGCGGARSTAKAENTCSEYPL